MPTANKLVAEGDSLTSNGGSWYNVYLAARPGITGVNVATGGQGLPNVVASMDSQIYGNDPEVVGVFLQANDLAGGTYSTGDAFAEALLSQFVDPVRATGIKVVGFTSMPQALPAGNPTIANPKRAAFDSAMRTAYSGGRLDGLVDVAADPVLGPEANATDTTIFSDGLHLTGAGYARLGWLAIPALDEAFGYASDTTPAAFTIPPQTGAAASTIINSGAVSPTGYDTPTTISVTGGDAQIQVQNSGYWVTSDTIPVGGSFRVRRTSSATAGATVSSTVTVGGVSDDYDITTASGSRTRPVLTPGACLYHNGGFSGTTKTWTGVTFADGYPVFYAETDGGGRDVSSITVNGISCTRIINHAVGKDLFIANSPVTAGNYDVVLTMSGTIGQVWVPTATIDSIDSTTPTGTAQLSFAFRTGGNQLASPSLTLSGTSLGIMIGRRGTSTGTLAVNSVGPNGSLRQDYGPGSTTINLFWGEFLDSGQPYFNKTGDANSFLLAAAFEGEAGAGGGSNLSGSSALTFDATGSITATGALSGASNLSFTPSGSISATGAMSGASSLAFTTAGSLTANGSLGGATSLTFSLSGDLSSGSATGLSGSSGLTFATAATLIADGALSGAAVLSFVTTGQLSGSIPRRTVGTRTDRNTRPPNVSYARPRQTSYARPANLSRGSR